MTPERRAKIETVLNHRQPDMTVIVENLEDQHNVFAILRTCDSVGIQDIYVIQSRTRTEHSKAGFRSSRSASKWVDIHWFESVETCMEVVKKKFDHILAAHLDADSKSLYDLELTEPVALVFGNERTGISDELFQHCNGSFLIPQTGMIQSLNVSVACAVTLYEAYRQRIAKGYYNGSARMEADAYQILTEKWSAYSSPD